MIVRVLAKCLRSRVASIVLRRNLNQSYFRKITTAHNFTRNLSSDSEQVEILDIEGVRPIIIKDILYPFSTDPVVQQINECCTRDDLMKFVIRADELNKNQVSQLILALWSQQKSAADFTSLDLDNLIKRISQLSAELSIDELCCDFLYLHKLGVNRKDPMMETLSKKIVDHINEGDHITLQALSQFTVAISGDNNLYYSILAVATVPPINLNLAQCDNADDLLMLTICLNNISHIVPLSVLDVFKTKVKSFLDQGLLNEMTSRCIFRIINFLNYPHWSWRNGKLLRQLLLELEDNIKYFETRDLLTLNRAFQSQLESARLVPRLVDRAQTLMKIKPEVELLSLAVMSCKPEQRTEIAELVRQFISNYQITSNHSSETLQTVFKILRLLKISDISLCDSYWTKVINEIYTTQETNLGYRLAKYIQKYMFFNNNLGGTYRHIEFEKSMIEMLKLELKTPKILIPKNFATFASFIIAYEDGSQLKKIPQTIVDKIEALHDQFTIKDCLQLSRGLQILQEMRLKRSVYAELQSQIDAINFSLGKSAELHLKADDLHLVEKNAIIKAYNIRRAPKDTYLFHDLIKYYDTRQPFDLNSRNIREITYNLKSCNFQMDAICDQMIDYILENWDHITGDTIEKILTCCYNLSYFPDKIEVLERSSEIVVRDFNFMSGLNIVQALLALVFYKSCPQQLIAMVFSAEFIKRLEQEIAMCYSKNTYPQRVMNLVMQLNRAVCLDCPEVNVKWFQQSFMEAQASKAPVIHSRLHLEVKSLLTDILKSPDLLSANRVTPYGYRVDFELCIDQYNRFIKPPPEDYQNINYMPNINRIAVLLLSNKVFCDNDVNRLKGAELLRMRHLEMLGYRVIHVKISDLNYLYKSVAGKLKYLKSLLQLTA